METMDLAEKRRGDTYQEALEILEKEGKCLIVRPPGFGKTVILSKVITSDRYKKVLYFYPSDITKESAIRYCEWTEGFDKIKMQEKCRCISYMKLATLKEKEFEDLKGIDLIILDEAHRIGADKTNISLQKLIELNPDAHLLGASATPDRMDLFDVTETYFDNIVTSPYMLHDAFQDGILQKPYYCFCTYGKKDYKNVERKLTDKAMNIPDVLSFVKSQLIEISNLMGMEDVIRKVCDQCTDTDYMKFIVFFSGIKNIDRREKDVIRWFKEAYPDHYVEATEITSRNSKTKENLKKLPKMEEVLGKIDLIFSCDMLNMGYHVENLTGIMMYRGTNSHIIYMQQLGRVLNSGNKKSGIIFDVVDNLHRECFFQISPPKIKEKRRMKRLQELEKKIEENGRNIAYLTDEEKEEYEKCLAADANKEKGDGWWHHVNDLTPEDLITVGNKATYEELITKCDAEVYNMRCKKAYAAWLEAGGDDSIKTKEAILAQSCPPWGHKLNGVPIEAFADCKKVAKEDIFKVMGIE